MPPICKLGRYGFLKVSGPDAVSFLQGYTTNDLTALEAAQMNAICNLQGRMVTSFLAARHGEDLILRMDKALVPKTIAFLGKYIVFSRAALEDISESFTCYGVLDEGKADAAEAPVHRGQGLAVAALGRRELWLDSKQTPAFAGSSAPWFDAEIDAGIAWVSANTSEKYLPQMFNYQAHDAIDFNKGCYLGQEIVARMQYRGELKKKLHRLPLARAVGTPLDKGEIIAAGARAALAVLRNPGEADIEVTFDDGERTLATPVQARPLH